MTYSNTYGDGHEHLWRRWTRTRRRTTAPKGVDVCDRCGVEFLDHARGFGSNVMPRKRPARA